MTDHTLEAQLSAVRAELETRPPGLVAHVLRVQDEALTLAGEWDADPIRVRLAVWGHDLFRSFAEPEQLRLAAEVGVPIAPQDEASPIMLHGPIAAVVMRDRFGVTDAEVLEAVADHTAGYAAMPLIAKIVLIADKVEKRKRTRTPAMKPIRRLAMRDLDTALLCWADWKWVQECENGWSTYPQHWEARQVWVHEHHRDDPSPPAVLPKSRKKKHR
ncbi:hypothetical protein AYO38_11985 [bacterium SCGC AG-212-C10]|nr:hypothetical protein AYO38_11985 [bacterium SCGC AG-212-C10]